MYHTYDIFRLQGNKRHDNETEAQGIFPWLLVLNNEKEAAILIV